MTKRLIVMIMTICMLAGSLPVSALAMVHNYRENDTQLLEQDAEIPEATGEAAEAESPGKIREIAEVESWEEMQEVNEEETQGETQGETRENTENIEETEIPEETMEESTEESEEESTEETEEESTEESTEETEEETQEDEKAAIWAEFEKMLAKLPDPQTVDPLNEERLEALHAQIGAILSYALENGLYDTQDEVTSHPVIAALLEAMYAPAEIPEENSVEENTDVTIWDGISVDTSWYTGEEFHTIGTAAQLAGLAKLVNDGNNFAGKTVRLDADLDLNNQEWTPIGIATATPFCGTFDGGNHTVSNLSVTDGRSFAGLFGRVGQKEGGTPGTIQNITVDHAVIQGNWYVGAVAGIGLVASFINCDVTGNVTISGYASVGGVVGQGIGSIRDCDVSGNLVISGSGAYVGGIAGNGYYNISDCTVSGDESGSSSISTGSSYVGGIIGFTGEGKHTITDCSAKNLSISGVDTTGGIAGIAHQGMTIKDSQVDSLTITTSGNDGTVGAIAGVVNGNAGQPNLLANDTVSNTTVNGTVPTTQTSGLTSSGAQNDNYFVGDKVVLDDSGKVVSGNFSVFKESIKDTILTQKGDIDIKENGDGSFSVQNKMESTIVLMNGDTVWKSIPVPTYQEYTLPTDITDETYLFSHWSESGSTDKVEKVVPNVKEKTYTYYAQWASELIFDANGGVFPDGSDTVTILVPKGKSAAEAVADQNTEVPEDTVREGYTGTGWYTAETGGDRITEWDSVIPAGTVTYYWQWTPNQYTIRFDANGGSGTMGNVQATYDAVIVLPGNGFVKADHQFKGWTTAQNGTTAEHADGASVKNLATEGTVTLYAVWTPKSAPTVPDSSGGQNSSPSGDAGNTQGGVVSRPVEEAEPNQKESEDKNETDQKNTGKINPEKENPGKIESEENNLGENNPEEAASASEHMDTEESRTDESILTEEQQEEEQQTEEQSAEDQPTEESDATDSEQKFYWIGIPVVLIGGLLLLMGYRAKRRAA